MPTLSRTFIDYACYHVIIRGNQKQTVFREEDDFIKYFNILKRALKKYDIRLYSYCLMPNHVHMLIEPVCSRNMSKFMHWLNRGYTAYFNTKYDMVGHLWQGRFKSKPILKGEYLIHCANYIEANPVRAGMTSDISLYEWSSYNERCFTLKKTIIDDIVVENKYGGTLLISKLGTV